jgi:hypothetical protein
MEVRAFSYQWVGVLDIKWAASIELFLPPKIRGVLYTSKSATGVKPMIDH